MRKRGVHYWVTGMPRAQCGNPTSVRGFKSTVHTENVTCGRCLRALKAEHDRGPPPMHWLRIGSLYQNTAMCGQARDRVLFACSFDEVTCAQCRRLTLMANPRLAGPTPRPLPTCQHDPFRTFTTVRWESQGDNMRLRCTVCNATTGWPWYYKLAGESKS